MTPSKQPRNNILHPELRGGFSRAEASAYVGVAPATFDKMVEAGEMPAPRIFKSTKRKLWYKPKIDDVLAGHAISRKSTLDERYA